MVFDGLDGRVARWTGTESSFGKEYDSLADMVAFGVAPAVLVYQWGVIRISEYGARVAPVRLGHRVLLLRCARRCAWRASIRASASGDKRYFGACRARRPPPRSPRSSGSSAKWREPGLPGLVLAFAVTGYAAALMVSAFSYLSLKQIDVDKRVKYSYIAFVILPMLVLISVDPPTMLFAMFVSYATYGPVQWLVRKLRRPRSAGAALRRAAWDRCATRISTRSASTAGFRATRRLRSLRAGAPRRAICAPPSPAARISSGDCRAFVPLAPSADWGTLRERVAACTACELCKTRTQTVFGVGNTQRGLAGHRRSAGRRGRPAGRAVRRARRPAAQRHAAGDRPAARDGVHRQHPQVPAAGQSRPEAGRGVALPAVSCRHQIALLKPKIILAVGRIAAQNLLATDAPLARLRGKLHRFGEADTPLVVTYHPAYLLRTPADKRKAWEDLKFARATYARVAGG